MFRREDTTYGGFVRFTRPSLPAHLKEEDSRTSSAKFGRALAAVGFDDHKTFIAHVQTLTAAEQAEVGVRFRAVLNEGPNFASQSHRHEEALQNGYRAAFMVDHDPAEWLLANAWNAYQKRDGKTDADLEREMLDPQRFDQGDPGPLGLAEYAVAVEVVRRILTAENDDVQPIDIERHPAFQAFVLLRRSSPAAVVARLIDFHFEDIRTASLHV